MHPARSRRVRISGIPFAALVALTVALTALSSASLTAQIPSPKDHLGKQIGADGFLANYTQLRSYWAELAERSDRMVVETFGQTSYGQPMQMAVISAPANLARLEEIRSLNRQLALGRVEDDAAARAMAERSRSIIWIDAGMHATESVAAQNIIELAYRMTSGDSEEVKRILEEVVLVVVPANPDGMEMIANVYMATGRVGSLPVLYQKYIGHDNNRDYYAIKQRETQALCRALYHTWLPQVIYNHHQSAPRGTIIFTPPFRDPYNHNFDPSVVRGINLVAAHMNRRFASEGKKGVISRTGAPYSAWWNGGLRTAGPFHNIIGILTESFGRPDPTPIEPSADRLVPYGDYPDPIGPQMWHARQTIEYLQTANFAILDFASRYREDLILDQWRMARRSIARGRTDSWTSTPKLAEIAKARRTKARAVRQAAQEAADNGEGAAEASDTEYVDAFTDPTLRDARVYVLPADQPNYTSAVHFMRCLRHAAIEVHRSTAEVTVGERTYPVGSFFLFADQAFRPHLIDMFEPQWHPDLVGTGGEPVRPYDAAGWTLALQHDVEFDRLLEPLASRADMELIEEVEVPFAVPAPASVRAIAGYTLPLTEINAFAAINRLLARGVHVRRVRGESTVWVPARGEGANGVDIGVELGTAARALGVPSTAVARGEEPELAEQPLRKLRIGLHDVYGGNMATGWTEWALREFEFPVQLVFAPRIAAGSLRDDFDVLMFHTGVPTATRRDSMDRALRGRRGGISEELAGKVVAALPPFEDWSDVMQRRERLSTDTAIPALQEFVVGGGTLIAFGRDATRIAQHFDLPVDEGVRVPTDNGKTRPARDTEFFVPGSLLWLDVAQDDPMTAGASPRLAAMFRRSPVFTIREGARDIRALATYATEDVLASGWAKGGDHLAGKAAAVSAQMGDGHIHLFGADVMYRGQPLGTMKLVFNALIGTD